MTTKFIHDTKSDQIRNAKVDFKVIWNRRVKYKKCPVTNVPDPKMQSSVQLSSSRLVPLFFKKPDLIYTKLWALVNQPQWDIMNMETTNTMTYKHPVLRVTLE